MRGKRRKPLSPPQHTATRKREQRFRRLAVTSNADQMHLMRRASFESLTDWRAILLIVNLWFLAIIASGGLLSAQPRFVPANYGHLNSHDLRLFPTDGSATVVNIPFPVWGVKFSGDGRSLYASTPIDQRTKPDQNLVRIDFNPTRSTPVTGTQGFTIKDFAVTQDGSKVVISGRHQRGDLRDAVCSRSQSLPVRSDKLSGLTVVISGRGQLWPSRQRETEQLQNMGTPILITTTAWI